MRSPRPLRRRIRNQICLAVVVALALFALPLAVAIDQLLTSQAIARLQRDASWAVAAVPDTPFDNSTRVPVPPGQDDARIGLYTPAGQRVGGSGPAVSTLAAAAADGVEHHGADAGDLVVTLPVLSDGKPVGSVRAAVPRASLRNAIGEAWTLLAVLAGLVLGAATLLARYSAIRIAKPFEHITRSSRDLAAGQESATPPTSGITEADAASNALHESSLKISGLLRAEREFVRDASHQLRTPLAALSLHLQHDPPDVGAALERADHLEATIADLLALRSTSPAGTCRPAEVVRQVVARRRAIDPITLRVDDTPDVLVSEHVVRQCLDILLDNAVRHGAPPIVVTVEAYGDVVTVEVADHGPGFAEGSVSRTGLSLASQLARDAGGQLLIRRPRPQPRIGLVFPAAPDTADVADRL